MRACLSFIHPTENNLLDEASNKKMKFKHALVLGISYPSTGMRLKQLKLLAFRRETFEKIHISVKKSKKNLNAC
ncbi:MAG: hypothetical protein R2824_26650 [Saprospiraceae bacterium]